LFFKAESDNEEEEEEEEQEQQQKPVEIKEASQGLFEFVKIKLFQIDFLF